jgi:microsomal dipeptidase-like Zn-dependent dipeptidase
MTPDPTRPRQPHRRAARLGAIAVAAAALLAAQAAPARAERSCGPSERFAADLWKNYGELARRYGCAGSESDTQGMALARTVGKCERDPMIAAKIRAGLVRRYRDAQVTKSITNHPARLRFAAQHGKLVSTLGRTWIDPEPYELEEVEVELTKLDGRGKVSVEACAHGADGVSRSVWIREIDNGKDNIGRTFRHTLRGVKGAIVSVTIDGKSVANSFEYKLRLVRPGQGKIYPLKKRGGEPIKGFADLHNHQMSYLGFAGGWVYPGTDERIESCTGENHGRLWTATQKGNRFRSKHPDRTEPRQWTHHMDTTHQQNHMRHLEEAKNRGLKLIVMSAVSNEYIAKGFLHPEVRDPNLPRDDMDSVRLQLRAARALTARYPWYRIARDPAEARAIIASGGLAVVLGVEISNFMPKSDGEWRHQLEELYDLGVRSVEIAHEADSQFAGAAAHHGMVMWLAQFINHLSEPSIFRLKNGENRLGLTGPGRALVRELARRHMLIEIDHLSRKARRETFDIVSDRARGRDGAGNPPPRLRHYPLFFSHSRFEELMPTKDELHNWIGDDKDVGEKEAKAHSGWGENGSGEYMASDAEALWVRATGGVFGLRTGPNAIRTYERSRVENRCLSSSRSLAQLYAYGMHRFGIAMALGTDMGGFVAQTAPRFGALACSRLGKQEPDNERRHKPLRTPFDYHGLANISLAPDLLKDLGNLGLNMGNLGHSAETFIRMWERTYDGERDELDAEGYASFMGTRPPDDVRPADAKATAGGPAPTGNASPTCPSGYRYEMRDPLRKDRCLKKVVSEKPLECKLLITDKKKNWTGPHATKGADECRSKKGKDPKGVKCPGGFDHQIRPGADSCTRTEEKDVDPICPGGRKQKSERGMDRCEK